MTLPLLTILVFLPLAGALALPLFGSPQRARTAAFVVATLELAIAAWITAAHPAAGNAPLPGFFLFEDLDWIGRFGIRYTLGMDGISLLMALLTAFVTLAAMVTSRRGITEKVALHYGLLLAMETGIMGVFLSLDLFLFYLFWEMMLIPMFLLIGIWGHGRRIYSAVKFFIFTLSGSLLMLLALIGLYLIHGKQTGLWSFGLAELLKTNVPADLAPWLFAAFLLAFAVKVPLVPVHTWLPDAHTDAPTAGSVILAGLLLKTGAYGLIRFGIPFFPSAAKGAVPLLFTLAVAGIVYASWIAYAQKDMKRLVAYSSVGHMGFVVLGIAAWSPVALSGAVVQMVNHGITTGALFAMVGMLDERAGTREIDAFGGLWGRIPVFSFFFLFFSMASAGLPGLNNFVGEFTVLVGTFKVQPLPAAIAFVGIVLPLAYTVRLVQEALFTEPRGKEIVADLSLREGGLLAVLALTALYLGVHPAPLFDMVREPVAHLVSSMGGMP